MGQRDTGEQVAASRHECRSQKFPLTSDKRTSEVRDPNLSPIFAKGFLGPCLPHGSFSGDRTHACKEL